MIIKEATFITSCVSPANWPPSNRPEFAMIGRSNVGKSSLINMITGINKLAKISERPGKTQTINYFSINEQWYLVDLPGYGYAKTSKTKRAEFGKIIHEYIFKRESLTCLFVLIDSRHEPLKSDLEFLYWVGSNGVPVSIVFTKSDKSGVNKLKSTITQYLKKLKEDWEELPPYFITSSKDKSGREELMTYIENILKEQSNPKN